MGYELYELLFANIHVIVLVAMAMNVSPFCSLACNLSKYVYMVARGFIAQKYSY